MGSRLKNFKFLNYNNDLRLGGGSNEIIYSSPSIREKYPPLTPIIVAWLYISIIASIQLPFGIFKINLTLLEISFE